MNRRRTRCWRLVAFRRLSKMVRALKSCCYPPASQTYPSVVDLRILDYRRRSKEQEPHWHGSNHRLLAYHPAAVELRQPASEWGFIFYALSGRADVLGDSRRSWLNIFSREGESRWHQTMRVHGRRWFGNCIDPQTSR